MVKVDLVTGFLGSGKTTFIKKYVSHLIEAGERVGILENDYGAINVDMLMLAELRGEQCELEMVAGGCDADCYRRRFKTKLISMAMSGYTRVVIEPSGIFNINEFYDILRDEPLDNWYEIGSVFCILDACMDTNLSAQGEYVLGTQIANSGRVVFSRAQEASKEQVEGVVGYVNAILCKLSTSINLSLTNLPSLDHASTRAATVVLPTSGLFIKDWDELTNDDYELLLQSGYRINECEKKYDFDDLDYESIYYMESGLDIDQMQKLAHSLFQAKEDELGHIIRVKGFVRDESGWIELNASVHGVNVREIPVGQEVFIVIGEKLNKDAINMALGLHNTN